MRVFRAPTEPICRDIQAKIRQKIKTKRSLALREIGYQGDDLKAMLKEIRKPYTYKVGPPVRKPAKLNSSTTDLENSIIDQPCDIWRLYPLAKPMGGSARGDADDVPRTLAEMAD